MSRRIKYLMTVLLVLALSGCASIPTSGPVESQPRRTAGQAQGGVTIVANHPPKGASASMIIRGFLTAMASFNETTAREYLTDQAAATWQPDSQVLVYASASSPRVNGNQVTISAPLIGYVDADGSFSGAEESVWNHDFGMVMEDGELRISNPPPGVALSQFMFSQSYLRIDAYFFPTSGTTLVPDPRYVQRGAWDRTTAAQLVVSGPSAWLQGIVDDPPQRAVSWGGDQVALSPQGTADVPLSCPNGLGRDDATQIAIEIAATVRDMAGVNRIRVLCDGTPMPLTGAAPDMSVPVGIADASASVQSGTAEDLAVVQGNVVATMTSRQSTPVNGDWGVTQRALQSLAISQTGQLAAVSIDTLLVGPMGSAPPTVALSTPGLLRPQFDAQGNVWAVSSSLSGTAVSVVTPTGVVPVDSSAVASMDIRGFQVSPDGHRILLWRQVDLGDGPRTELGIALITYDGDAPSAIISWKPIRLIWEGTPLRSVIDVAWLGPSSVLVLSASGVYFADIDGLEVDSWGLPQAWTPVEMSIHATAASPQIAVLDQSGIVWSYQNGYWFSAGENISSVAYAS
ncbi:MAG: LpqB family beta-propeller domain-containing protein [Propionibacteriaceae bacterium]|nr:LpqB family beta-propeller domain-containing protein [Propionibacteriaceae bacterium]